MKPAVRISISIVALSTSLLILADSLFSIFPDPSAPLLKTRADFSESLAIQYSSLVNDNRIIQIKPAMDATVAQMPEVLSMGMRTVDGHLLAKTAEHESIWSQAEHEQSTPNHVRVPIFQGKERWGTMEVGFDDLRTGGFFQFLNTPLYKLILIMAAAGFIAYLFYLSRTLRYLDPSSVVPDRVRAALDQLVEGVFIVDHEQRIVLVNSAFARKVGQTPDALLGLDPSGFSWAKDDADNATSELPWATAMRDGTRLADIRLELESPTLGLRAFSTNVSPIVDGGGKARGVLASFDDVSDIEKMNHDLRDALGKLERAHEEVNSKNEELFRLATVDPLTGCLNRRAFFEKFELEFDLAKRDELQLSVVMADIDHFKKINDDFGHAVGDAVIKEMTNVLADSSRVNDHVGRYGGEEFCMVLVDANIDVAIKVSNRARLAFEQRSQQSDSPTGGRKVTASFGVSTITFGAADVAEFLNQADQALYESKNNGRNRVTNWISLDSAQREIL